MADIGTLIQNIERDGTVRTIMRNPRAQFGTAARPLLGATLLPEVEVPENAYREEAIRLRTIIANAGTRYGPAQKKGGDLVASFLVELSHSDIARELTSRDFDALRRLVGASDVEAMARLIDFMDRVNLGLVELNEVMRWQAIVSAAVTLTGDNGYSETVSYANPSGHRANAAGTWSSDAYDPFDGDIFPRMDLLASKGYQVNRIISSRNVVSILGGNDKVKARTGVATINASGQITSVAGRASLTAINDALQRDGLPPIEMYDLLYRNQTGTARFLASNVFVMVATTGQDATVDQGDSQRILNDTLGYMAIGTPAGQDTPGRAMYMQAFRNKPPRVEAEAWQASLPVVTEPEAIAVIAAIA